MTAELSGCPFCGKQPTVVRNIYYVSIACKNHDVNDLSCRAGATQDPNATGKELSPNDTILTIPELYEQAAKKWNTRK